MIDTSETVIYECVNQMTRALRMLRQAAVDLGQPEIAEDVASTRGRLTTPGGRVTALHLLTAHEWRGDRWTPAQTALAQTAYSARNDLREAIDALRGVAGERQVSRPRAEWRMRCLDATGRAIAALAVHIAVPTTI